MHSPAVYEIRVQERLDAQWASWLAPMTLRHTISGETVLTGRLRDQAELHGLLMKVRDLNLLLLEVKRVEPERPHTA